MSKLLKVKTNGRSKREIDDDIENVKQLIKDQEAKLKELEAEAAGVITVSPFAKRKKDILFMDFSKNTVVFNDCKFNCGLQIDEDESEDTFYADCGSCRSDVNDYSHIDCAIETLETRIQAYKTAIEFFKEQRAAGVEYIADCGDCDAFDYDFEYDDNTDDD